MSTTLYHRQPLMSLRGKGEPVTIVGKIKSVNSSDSSFTIECDPENQSTGRVKVPQNIDISQFHKIVYIEVHGKSTGPRQVEMVSYTNFLQNFDLKCYNQMLSYASKDFKQLFY